MNDSRTSKTNEDTNRPHADATPHGSANSANCAAAAESRPSGFATVLLRGRLGSGGTAARRPLRRMGQLQPAIDHIDEPKLPAVGIVERRGLAQHVTEHEKAVSGT